MLKSTWDISILPRTCWSFSVGLNENANSFFATRCCFWSGKNTQSSSELTNTALSDITGETRWSWDQSTNHSRLASRKEGLWKNEPLSESFVSRWASKVKINAFYKTIKVFFDLACMSTCCWGLPKPKHEPFITHNRGTLSMSNIYGTHVSRAPWCPDHCHWKQYIIILKESQCHDFKMHSPKLWILLLSIAPIWRYNDIRICQ